MQNRLIELNEDNIKAEDEILLEENNYYNVQYECWFDVDKYFGTNTNDDEDTWINFYVNFYPKLVDDNVIWTLKPVVILNGKDTCEELDWKLTQEEETLLLMLASKHCVDECGLTLTELYFSDVQDGCFY